MKRHFCSTLSKRNVFTVSIMIILISAFTTYVFLNPSITSVTETTTVVTKAQSETEQWIILANDKKVYMSDFSTWALLEENEEYTVSYESKGKSGKNVLTAVVPQDFNGQF